MKKLLFLQLDDAHFVAETKLFLKRYAHELVQYELFLFAPNDKSKIDGPWKKITRDEISNYHFEMILNLSLSEESWEFAKGLKSPYFVGTRSTEANTLQVIGHWSTYLLQLKGGASFLPFHLQDIYKNIVGCKSLSLAKEKTWKDEVIYWQCPHFINENVFLILVAQLKERYKNWDFIHGTPLADKPGFYIGPANHEVSLWHEQNHRLLILKNNFEGLHFAPAGDNHWLVNPHHSNPDFTELYKLMIQFCEQIPCKEIQTWEVYQTTQENLFGTSLKPLTMTNDNFPFYQFHVVIWQYVLNLFDVNLEIAGINKEQETSLKFYEDVLVKVNRFLDLIVSNLADQLEHFDETNFDIKKFQAAITEIQDFESTTSKIAENHPLLRPFLDYYQIVRGESEFSGLKDQLQDQMLILSEQSGVLKALLELISMTIQNYSSKIEKTSQGRERHGNDREF